MAYLDARDLRGLGAEIPQAVSAGSPIRQAISRERSGSAFARPMKMNLAPKTYSSGGVQKDFASTPGASTNRTPPAGAVATPTGFAIPSVVAVPSSTISPLIAALPTGAPTEEFDYGAPTGGPFEEFDYGAPTGAPAEEYGDAAEAPVSAAITNETPSQALPIAAAAALAGAAIGLGPIGIALAAGAGFLFGKR